MGERVGPLTNEIMASKDLGYEQAQKLIKSDEIVVRGDALLFNSLFILYNFLLDHLDRTLVHHLNLYLSICLVKHLLWLSVNGGG